MKTLLDKGQSIQSRRTGKVLKCYCVMPVMRGSSDKIVDYTYHFVNEQNKFKSIRHHKLSEMINGVWEHIG